MTAQPVDVLAVLDACKGQAHVAALTHSTSEAIALHYNDVRATRDAVAELIEANERTARHLEAAVAFIEQNYPGARQLDAGPIMRNMKRWGVSLRAALARCQGGAA